MSLRIYDHNTGLFNQRNLEPSMSVFWFAGEMRSRQFLAGGWVAAASLTAISTIQFSKHQSQHNKLVKDENLYHVWGIASDKPLDEH
ncbi:uncharacterized protein Bfra_004959 [Botrytis fragariae]|uniref:Uncharacterized protein n=1 Tax=Botrytis fragariae TaxID=1964551 RepID=A0A8H6EII0_9HELO|nr:uncharacterized protein Bfra_004959 [Botrytis fragariae]KAF5873498.1 hypothetical protein Bfra_004959 [Botrytis fragariae]